MYKQNIDENNLPLDVKKYLKKYGNQNWEITTSFYQKYNTAIVIPAINEYENIKKLIASLSQNDSTYFSSTLIVFVINNFSQSEKKIIEDNRKAIELILNLIDKKNKATEKGLNFALVDMSSEGKEMPEKEGGVGLARKTGMDLALTIFDYANKTPKTLVCLDADCTVSKNYITTINISFNGKNIFAGHLDFIHLHRGSTDEKLAIICYEIFLRYYLLGLKIAKSPYAFHTIGSTMACTHSAYIKIEGMNKRKAAEDFYFMEKLSKNFTIEEIKEATVFPSGRGSTRVPFGTGQRVNRFLLQTQNEYLLYNPESFLVLKKWLELFLSEENFSAEKYLEKAEKIHPMLKSFLLEQSFEKTWNKILQNGNKTQLYRQKRIWFDGFKTLKLIHFLRDNGLVQENMFVALNKLLSLSEPKFEPLCSLEELQNKIPNIGIQLKYLQILRELA